MNGGPPSTKPEKDQLLDDGQNSSLLLIHHAEITVKKCWKSSLKTEFICQTKLQQIHDLSS